MRDESDVIVVGAGPVGLLLGNLLGRLGVRTLLLERGARPPEEARAVSIDDEALRVLQAAGLADECAADMLLEGVGAIYFNGAGERLFEVRPSLHAFGFPLLTLFHQPSLEATLRRGLARYPHVELAAGCEVDAVEQGSDTVRVRGSGADGARFEARAAYLVGCDGGRSFVRQSQQIGLSGTTFRERWLVLDADTDGHDEHDVHFHCDPKRPAVRVPGPAGRLRWEFMLSADERDADALSPQHVAALLARHPQPPGLVLRRQAVYTFHARNALRYRQRRVFLAGDAAHLLPPFFGQGVSTGFRDALNLSWKLAWAVAGRSGDALLDTYHDERRPHAEMTTRASVMLGRIVMTRNAAASWARDRFFQSLSGWSNTAEFLREARFKPPSKADACSGRSGRGPLVGRLLPQPMIEAAGERRRLDTELRNDFCLIGVDRDPDRALPPAALARFRQLGLRSFALAEPGGSFAGESRTAPPVDVTGRFAAMSGQFFAVRPDRFVAAHFRADEALAVADGLARVLTP